MSRLVDRDIRARCGSNPETSLIYPFDKDSLQPCSYDLHLAGDYMTELPVDEGKDTDADVTAPNTGAVIANASLVVLGIAVAVLTAVYAARFANARK